MAAELMRGPLSRPVLAVNGKRLNSARDPFKEATRILTAQIESSDIKRRIPDTEKLLVFLLNPPLGLVENSAKELLPGAQIYSLISDAELYAFHHPRKTPGAVYLGNALYCGNPLSLPLYSIVSDLDFMRSIVLEWPASRSLSGHDLLREAVVAHFRELQASYNTRSFYGPRWMSNYRLHKNRHSIRRLHKVRGPVFLCASGPSLEDSMHTISSNRSKVHLWALPSAVAGLKERDLTPDVVISSDGGYWASVHLDSLAGESHLVLARSAYARPSQLDSFPSVEFFSLSMCFEIPNPEEKQLAERGSVIFSALDVLGTVARGPVILFGMDFGSRGLQSHIRPHGFDGYIECRNSRLEPLTSQRFNRSLGNDWNIYSRWFSALSLSAEHGWPPLYRVRRDGVKLPVPELKDADECQRIIDCAEHYMPPVFVGGSPHHAAKMSRVATGEVDMIPPALPSDLLSSPDRKKLRELIIMVAGLRFKECYAQWLAGEDEAEAVLQLASGLRGEQK